MFKTATSAAVTAYRCRRRIPLDPTRTSVARIVALVRTNLLRPSDAALEPQRRAIYALLHEGIAEFNSGVGPPSARDAAGSLLRNVQHGLATGALVAVTADARHAAIRALCAAKEIVDAAEGEASHWLDAPADVARALIH